MLALSSKIQTLSLARATPVARASRSARVVVRAEAKDQVRM